MARPSRSVQLGWLLLVTALVIWTLVRLAGVRW